MAKRRANREGTIYRRQDGRWVASVTLPAGRRKSYYGKTREEVAQKLTQGLKAVQDGLPIPSEQIKTGSYLKEWLQAIEHTIRPSTWRRYEQLIRVHAAPWIGNVTLTRLEPGHLQKLYANCLSKGSAPATVRQLHAVIRHALGQADKWGMVARNVATLVSPPRLLHHEITVLSAEQTKVFLNAAQGDRFYALYVLALTAGMRMGELLGLRWSDIDLEGGSLQVRHTLSQINAAVRLQEPKTAQSRRRIALTTAAVESLRRHRLQQTEARLQIGPAWENLDFVFSNEIGRPMNASNFIQRSFLPLLQKACLPRVRFHDLRHTCATLLLQQGVHVKVVSELLGHSDTTITLNIYSHVLPDMQREAVNAMDALLKP